MTVLLFVLLPVAVWLAWRLHSETKQRRQLSEWLRNAETQALPDGSGAWRDVFSGLHRLRKTELHGRQVLQGMLERFRKAAQALPDGVILLGPAGHIEWLNDAASSHFRLDRERDVGTLVDQLIRHTGFHRYFEAYRAGGAAEPFVMRPEGEASNRVLSLMLIAFADTGTLLLSRDITEIAKTETIRRDFIANVSHELRTPLTVISGFLEQMNGETPPTGEAATKFLTLMQEQAQRMNRLVEDLLTLSRLENDTEPPREEEVDVAAMIESLLREARALSGGRHAVEADGVAAERLRGSPDELRSAFGNLVSNAVRYTPEGGTIRLTWKTEDDKLVFSVRDTGIGIPPEHIPRLTERFYRVDKGRSSSTGGTGLGLAIVKHVLARHRGQLAIRSTPGAGSEFRAEFPPARASGASVAS